VKKDQAEEPDQCVNQFCAPSGIEAAADAKTFAEVGQWVGIGGLATLAIGTTIFLTAPSEPDTERTIWLRTWTMSKGAGWSVGGRW